MKTVAKMALLAAFILRPCHWDAHAEAWARLLPHDSPEDYGEHFTALVRSGEAQAYELVTAQGAEGAGGSRVAIVIARVQNIAGLGEFVIEGVYCAKNHKGLTAAFLPQLEAKARDLGCATLRFHTMRPGLVETAVAAGYRVCEVICRKDVRHV